MPQAKAETNLAAKPKYPTTPDGRYFVVRGRLWRCTNPHLAEAERSRWVAALMAARREVSLSREDAPRRRAARAAVQQAKEALGERGAVWWQDGAVDYNRFLAKNTPYAAWWAALPQPETEG